MGNYFGLPVGISFIGTAFSESILIRLASGFEHVTRARIVPRFFPTLPLDNVEGIPLSRVRGGRGRGRHHSM
jgi:amidase